MTKLFTASVAQRRIQYGDIVKLDIGVVRKWLGGGHGLNGRGRYD